MGEQRGGHRPSCNNKHVIMEVEWSQLDADRCQDVCAKCAKQYKQKQEIK